MRNAMDKSMLMAIGQFTGWLVGLTSQGGFNDDLCNAHR